MSIALLRAPIYLLAHRQSYGACGLIETISIACSVVIASRNARVHRQRTYLSVSKPALKLTENLGDLLFLRVAPGKSNAALVCTQQATFGSARRFSAAS